MILTSEPPIIPRAEPDLAPVRVCALKLLAYCQRQGWAGYDPFDALNSRVFQALPFLHFRIPRLALTQLLKRSPINFRPLLRVPPCQNPKALALFISAILKLSRLRLCTGDKMIQELVQALMALRSTDTPYWCWGYPFPWQSRKTFFPRWLPNIICTTFAGNALLDLYDESGNSEYLAMAVSAADFILETLYYEETGAVSCFSYTPICRDKVHNANLWGAAFLARVANASGASKYLAPALRAARYTVSCQASDGSWPYGEGRNQRWVDNFHTGFNLCALKAIAEHGYTTEFKPHLRNGLDFYRGHFFRGDGAPRYYHNRTYPIDIHSVAQSIITLMTFRDVEAANVRLGHTVFEWAQKRMWSERGCFHYRVLRFCAIKTSYVRWAQAWMLLALSSLLESNGAGRGPSRTHSELPHQTACFPEKAEHVG